MVVKILDTSNRDFINYPLTLVLAIIIIMYFLAISWALEKDKL